MWERVQHSFFFACQRGWWCTIVDWYTPILCVENWPKEIWGRKKMCPSSLPWILFTFNSLENRFNNALKCNFDTQLFFEKVPTMGGGSVAAPGFKKWGGKKGATIDYGGANMCA